MLRITIHETDDAMAITLEGRIAGPWVAELGRAWAEAAPRLSSRKLFLNLRNVTYVDRNGEQALRTIYAATRATFRVMGMVHEHLYQTPDLGGVSLVAYLRGLVNVATAAHPREQDEVKFELDVEEVPLALDIAIPFGLLMNELLSNCLEHGFPKGRAGRVHVIVQRTANGVRMAVNDNGVGLPHGFDSAKCTAMGLKLAAGLAHQLGGTLEFASSGGCQVHADFTRMAGQLKSKSHGIGQRMVGANHPLLPFEHQAL